MVGCATCMWSCKACLHNSFIGHGAGTLLPVLKFCFFRDSPKPPLFRQNGNSHAAYKCGSTLYVCTTQPGARLAEQTKFTGIGPFFTLPLVSNQNMCRPNLRGEKMVGPPDIFSSLTNYSRDGTTSIGFWRVMNALQYDDEVIFTQSSVQDPGKTCFISTNLEVLEEAICRALVWEVAYYTAHRMAIRPTVNSSW